MKLLLLALFSITATPCWAYIDPGTSQTVISSLGAVLGMVVTFIVACITAFKFHAKSAFYWIKSKLSAHKAMAAVLAGAVILGIGYAGYKLTGGVVTTGNKLVLIGIDGMDPKVTQELMAQGKMPHFQALMNQGGFKELATINPVQSPVVWATIATGKPPGVHHITDFISRKNGEYTPQLSLVKQAENNLIKTSANTFTPPVDPKLFFWQNLMDHEIDSRVLRWPMTFPPKGASKMISGLGTPDILGGMGRYTLYTEDRSYFPEDLKGVVQDINVKEQSANSEITGPMTSQFMKKKAATVPIDFTLSEDRQTVSVKVQDQTLVLRKDHLSPWMKIEFPLGLGSKARGMVRFILIETSPSLHVYMSPIEIHPQDPLYPISEPASYATELFDEKGMFHTLGMSEDTNALGDEILTEEQFLMLCDAIIEEAEDIFWQEYRKFDGAFFSYVFDTIDRVQHVFWRFNDPDHPAYDTEKAKKFQNVITNYYIKADEIIGKVMSQLKDNTNLMVISDHGFTSFKRNFHLNSWLIQEGYMTLKGDADSSVGLFHQVDWQNTRAFSMGFSQIFLNIKGRDKEGIVKESEVAGLKQEIQGKLLELVDEFEGERPVKAVYDGAQLFGKKIDQGPELVVGLKQGYRFSWQTALGGAPARLFDDNNKAWSGDHCVDASFVPGVLFSNQPIASQSVSVYDIAPTVLEHFGIPAEGMQGKDIFASELQNYSQSPRRAHDL